MATKKWTVLAYLAGDNDLDKFGVQDINEMAKAGSNDDLNIVVQFDRAGGLGTRRFYIKENGGYDTDAVMELGQTNCGDPKVLGDFLTWGIKNYPASHYMVILWNHGSGWKEDDIYERARELSPEGRDISPFETRLINKTGRRGIKRSLFSTTVDDIVKLEEKQRGIAYDDGSKDFLDNKELKNALSSVLKQSKIKKFDIVGFDACLMNMLEVGYQIKDQAKITVGSEETEPGEGWPYDKIFGALAKKPDMAPVELASTAVTEYINSYDRGDKSKAVTQSAVNLEKINSVKNAADKLANNLIAGIKSDEVFDAVFDSSSYAQHFEDLEFLDLYDFARRIGEKSSGDEIRSNVQELTKTLESSPEGYVVASGNLGTEMKNAHGVSVYFPGRYRYSQFYDKLDMSKKGRWNEFIKAYQAEYDRRG